MKHQTQLQALEKKLEAYQIVIQATAHPRTLFEALDEYCLLAKLYNEVKGSYAK